MVPLPRPSLNRLLGFPEDARLLIVNCDDLGMLEEATQGCRDALDRGVATSASLMTPCPDAATAADCGPDIGVHLTVNCEFEGLRWGPLTAGWTLREPDGSLPASCQLVQHNVDLSELHDELLAQVGQALDWGVDVTHLDSHMYTVAAHPRLVDTYLDAAAACRLPVRLAGSEHQPPSDFRARAAARGVLAADHLVRLPAMGSRRPLREALRALQPGVTEFHAHPAAASDRLGELLPDALARIDDYDLYTLDVQFRREIAASGAIPIGHRPLREAMRRGW